MLSFLSEPPTEIIDEMQAGPAIPEVEPELPDAANTAMLLATAVSEAAAIVGKLESQFVE